MFYADTYSPVKSFTEPSAPSAPSLFPTEEKKQEQQAKPPKSSVPTIDPSITDTETEDDPCVVCLSHTKIIAFGCGHKQTCAECSRVLIRDSKPCPSCRQEITFAMRIF